MRTSRSRMRCFAAVLLLIAIALAVRSAQGKTYEELKARVERGGVVPINDLRRAQQDELVRLRTEYDAKAIAQGGQTDELLAEYRQAYEGIQQRYNAIDRRNTEISKSLKAAGAEDTGSGTKDVRADKDSGSPNKEVNKKVVEDMKAKGHDVDTSQPHKAVDRTDDHTHWLAETDPGKKAKAADTDAYRTTGGREAVGNKGEVRDALGEQLDHRGKFEHGRASGDLKTQGKTVVKAADSAGRGTFDPEGVTVSKSVGPDGKEVVHIDDGKFGKDPSKTLKNTSGLSEAEARRVYEQGKVLQNYGDDALAGITKLGDSPELQRQKIAKWQDDASKVMDAAEARGRRNSEIRDTVRENFQKSYENAKGTDSMQANPDPKVTDPEAARKEAAFDKYRTNDDPDFKNRAEGIERDRARVRESQQLGEDYVAGEKAKPTSKDTYTGGWKDPETAGAAGGAHGENEPHAPAEPETDLARSKPAANADAPRPSGAGDATAPDAPKVADTDVQKVGTADAPSVAKSVPDAGAPRVQGPGDTVAPDAPRLGDPDMPRVAKPAPDALPVGRKAPVPGATEFKEVKAGEGIGDEIFGGVETAGQIADAGARQMGKAVDENRDLGTQDAIDAAVDATGLPALHGAVKRNTDEEMAKVYAGEQGRVEAFGRTMVKTGKEVVVDPINEAVDRNLKEEEERARRAGEDPNYLRSSANAAAEIAGTFTGVKGIADAYGETQTWKERGDAAAQRAAVQQKVDDELRWRDKAMRALQGDLERLGMTGDVKDPKTLAEIEAKLTALRAEEDRLRRTTEMAERTLGDSDPERVARAKQIGTSLPRSGDIEDYVNQLLADQGARRGAETQGQPGEAAAGRTSGDPSEVAERRQPIRAGGTAGQPVHEAGTADANEATYEPAEEFAQDEDLAQLLEQAQLESRQAVERAAGAARESVERERMRVASASSQVRQAAEVWDPGPEVSVEQFKGAVIEGRVRRGEPLPGQEPMYEPGGGYPETGTTVAGLPPGGASASGGAAGLGGGYPQGRTSVRGVPPAGTGVPGAAGARGMDHATCMRMCLAPLQNMPPNTENAAEFRANLQRHCEFQCRAAEQAARNPGSFDPVQNCIDAQRNMNPGLSGEALAAVERTCRQAGAAVPRNPAPQASNSGSPAPRGAGSGRCTVGLLGQADCQ